MQHDSVTLFFRGFQQVAFGADKTLDRHHDFFTDRVDRRIGDLGKQLSEVIVEQARFVTQTSQRRVITH